MVASINWGKAPQLACWDKPAFCAVGRTLSWLWPLPLVITTQVISSTRILAALAMFPGKTNSRKTTGTCSKGLPVISRAPVLWLMSWSALLF
jgi:hypothetical protein